MQEIQETQFQSLGQEDPMEESMAIHSRILAWRTPWTEKPGRLQSMGSQRVGRDWSNLACTHLGGCWSSLACIPLPLPISCMEWMAPGVKIRDMESSPRKQDMGRGWTLPLRVRRKRNRKKDRVDGDLSTWDRNWHVPEEGMIREKDSLLSKTSERTLVQKNLEPGSHLKVLLLEEEGK